MSSFEQFEKRHVLPAPGRTLIVGSQVISGKPDRRALYRDVVGLDIVEGDGVDVLHDLEHPLPAELGTFAHIECMSVLEHVKRPWLAAETIEQALAPGGTLTVLVPFVWRFHDYGGDYWRMTPDALRVIFPNIEWVALELGHWKKAKGMRVPSVREGGHPYLARTETFGFGIRKPDVPRFSVPRAALANLGCTAILTPDEARRFESITTDPGRGDAPCES